MTVRTVFGAALALGVAALAALAWTRFEGDAPQIAAPEQLVVGADGREIAVELRDAGMGLQRIAAALVHAKGEAELLVEELPGSWFSGSLERERAIALRIDPKAMGLADGSAQLRISAEDWSWRRNRSVLEIPVEIDRVPPRVAVLSGLTYVDQGGAAAVVYQLSEATARDGVEVAGANGSQFYPGFAYPSQPAAPAAVDASSGEGAQSVLPSTPVSGQRIALFGVDRDAGKDAAIRVLAADHAGNEARAGWNLVLRPRAFPQGNVTLPGSFLQNVVPELAKQGGIDVSDPVEAFRQINSEMRRANEALIREKLAGSADEALWTGPFEQLENSKVTSRFAEARVYFVDGQQVSNAIHYGYDLASLARAEITAANAGRVRHAGDLGIYGGCVLLDHGLGVGSVYGHLSRIDVREGEQVAKGQRLGLSGATGLAGGDHLHFAILVGPTYVDPVEWWDEKWVREHIDAQLGR